MTKKPAPEVQRTTIGRRRPIQHSQSSSSGPSSVERDFLDFEFVLYGAKSSFVCLTVGS
jgi:hypothetical protein